MVSNISRAEEPNRTIRLELLDGFRLEVNGIRVDPLASAQRLLAFLALQGPVVRAVAAGTLWGGVPECQALASLRTTIWRVNRTVAGLVSVRQSQLALANSVRVDVVELADLVALVLDGSQGTSVPRLRTGELLPGWYEDWVLFERERLRQLRLHALEAAAVQLAARGSYSAALEVALEVVRAEPLRESAHRVVIAVHLAEDNLIEAVRAYERFRALSLDQFGVEPSQRLMQLLYARCPRVQHISVLREP